MGLFAAVAGADGPADEPPTAELEAGRRAYERCAVCHGADGGGRSDGTFPRIAGQHPEVVAAQLHAMREGTRSNPIMAPHARALLDDLEVAEVAAWVATLEPASPPGRGPGDDLERGATLYRSDCSSCHGEQAEGDAQGLVPSVSGQHYAYLLRRVRDLGSWRAMGHPRNGRPLEDYSDAELRAVVDHAARLGAAAPPPGSQGEAASGTGTRP